MVNETRSPVGHAEAQARARNIGIFVTGVGATVFFFGWGLDLEVLKRLRPDMASMKANTAMCFTLLGLALWRAHRRHADRASLALAGTVALVASLTLVEYITGLDFGIDQLFFRDLETDPSAFPGRMAMATAVGFFLGSSTLILLDTPLRKIASAFSLALVLLGLAALIGYLYSVEAFYSLFPFSSMALHTAACFFLLGAGIILARPDRDLMRPATGGRSGALLVRRLLPWTIAVPLFTGWLELLGQDAGLYPPHFGLALFTVVTTVVLATLVATVANRLNAAEKQLEKSETRFRALFADNPQAMCVCDRESLALLEVNDAAIELYGYSREEMLQQTLYDLALPEPEDASTRSPDPFRVVEGLHRHRCRNGRTIDVELISNEILHRSRPAFLVLSTNVSEKKRLERQLVQSQKMEAVGQLAGGIAHDFNNLLGVVKGYSDLLARNQTLDERGQFHVRQIGKVTERAASLTHRLLTFGRRQMLQPKLFALNEAVSDMVEMLRRILGENVRLVARLSPEAGWVRADAGQIEQVVMNLVLNARDAMPNGGELVLETRVVTIDETNRAEHPELAPGRYNLLIATDSGTGMDASTLDRIFDPFFTTKRPGKGTGLGLSTVYGIVKQSGGHIEAKSASGRGTTFEIHLPLVEPEKDRAGRRPATRYEPGSRPEGDDEHILLIEDTGDLRKILREILEEEGYHVTEAGSPSEALALAADRRLRLDLVIADVVMPGGSGPKTVERLRESRPNLRAIYMSGYLGEALDELGGIDPELEFLQKPFHTDSLLNKVRKALELTSDGLTSNSLLSDDLATEAFED